MSEETNPQPVADELQPICDAIASLCSISRRDMVEKGWWDKDRSEAECIALMHSELSEALEAIRHDEPALHYLHNGKPLGKMSEYADVILRITNTVGEDGPLLAQALREKILFNRTRPHRHGNKAL